MNRGLKLCFLSDFRPREAYNTCVETTKVQRLKDTKNVQIEHRKKSFYDSVWSKKFWLFSHIFFFLMEFKETKSATMNIFEKKKSFLNHL